MPKMNVSNILKEFKEFAIRGNMIDMAVGIVIGTAFGKVISSLVSDIIMPPIGMLLGKVDFSNLVITLSDKTANSASVAIKYGMFINTIIDFVIITFSIFIVIKQINRFKQAEDKSEKQCPYCDSKISIKATRCPDCTSQL